MFIIQSNRALQSITDQPNTVSAKEKVERKQDITEEAEAENCKPNNTDNLFYVIKLTNKSIPLHSVSTLCVNVIFSRTSFKIMMMKMKMKPTYIVLIKIQRELTFRVTSWIVSWQLHGNAIG